MNAATSCPHAERWTELLDGRLPEEDEADLYAHLDACDRCQQLVDDLTGRRDTLAAKARCLAEPQPGSGPGLRRVIQELKEELGQFSGGATANTPPADTFPFLAPPDRPGQLGKLGPYQIVQVVGHGGMGIVFKAFEPTLRRFVAVKVLAPQLAVHPVARERFAREARAAAAVTHANVVTVFGVDEAGGWPYLAMQYVAGQSLQQWLDRQGPPPVPEILRIGLEIASGLAAAHAKGIVHRDIKPANILLRAEDGRVKITDFGLARMADDARLTQTGLLPGTPQYMAPEQARGKKADQRSDLFSLGSVLYTLCTGRPPFRGGAPLVVLRRLAEETPPPVRTLNPNIPEGLARLIARLHAKDPASRFASAAEVAQRLRELLETPQPPAVPALEATALIAAPPPHPDRRRWLLVVAALLLLAVALTIFGVIELSGAVMEFFTH
jgi:eukaryotic-like serine/threonine-protein kinase